MPRSILALLAGAAFTCGAAHDIHGAECEEAQLAGFSFLQSHVHSRHQNQQTRDKDEAYVWASGRGNFPDYAVSPHSAPFNLNDTFAWKWHHPDGRFATLTYGTAIDDELNIYLSGADGVRKFDPKGVVLWEYKSLPAEVMNAPALYDGKVYGGDTEGHAFALDMKTGQVAWKAKLSEGVGQDNGFNMVRDGIALAACDWREPSPNGPANQKIKALNASNGEELWAYKPDTAVWNFLPLFVEGGSFVFQDMTGKAYRLDLQTGDVIWKNGGLAGTWTDGSGAVGPNGLVYAVNNNYPPPLAMIDEHNPGTLSAYSVSDGKLVWKVTTPRPPNNAPAIGKVKNVDGLALVQPLCQQVKMGATCDIEVYDAANGDLRWIFHGPVQTGLLQAGDFDGSLQRASHGVRSMCLPNGWSAPTIDAEGTVFVGNEEGNFYALKDVNNDGVVVGPDEVAAYDTKAAFSGSSSPAVAKGMVAVASCDSLFVFKA